MSNVAARINEVEVVDTVTKSLKIRPLYDRVLVKVTPPKEVMQNGILIPDTAAEKPQEGVVVAIGQGRVHPLNGTRIPMDVHVGEIVVFGRFSGNEVEILGEKMLLLKEDELMGEYYEE